MGTIREYIKEVNNLPWGEYNTPEGIMKSNNVILYETNIWADGCSPIEDSEENNFNPTFREINTKIYDNCGFTYLLGEFIVVGVSHSGYLVGRLLREFHQVSDNPNTFNFWNSHR